MCLFVYYLLVGVCTMFVCCLICVVLVVSCGVCVLFIVVWRVLLVVCRSLFVHGLMFIFCLSLCMFRCVLLVVGYVVLADCCLLFVDRCFVCLMPSAKC